MRELLTLHGRIEERADAAAGRKPRVHECVSSFGFAMEEPYPNGEDDVEATLAEVELLEVRDEELSFPGLDVRCIAPRSCLDHLRGAIDRGQSAPVEPLADYRRGHPVTAANLEDTVVGTNAELIDDRPESLTHSPNDAGRVRRVVRVRCAYGGAVVAPGYRAAVTVRGWLCETRTGAAQLVRCSGSKQSWLRDGRECDETLVEQLR